MTIPIVARSWIVQIFKAAMEPDDQSQDIDGELQGGQSQHVWPPNIESAPPTRQLLKVMSGVGPGCALGCIANILSVVLIGPFLTLAFDEAAEAISPGRPFELGSLAAFATLVIAYVLVAVVMARGQSRHGKLYVGFLLSSIVSWIVFVVIYILVAITLNS